MLMRSTRGIVLLLLIVILAGGCDSNAENFTAVQPIEEQLPQHSDPIPLQLSPVSLTLETVETELQQSLNRDQVRELFGVPTTSGETYIMMQGEYKPVGQDIYEAGNTKLITLWSKEGEMLYSVFYDTDPSGKRRSFLPAIGGMSASSSEANFIAQENRISIGNTVTLYKSIPAYEWWGGQQSVQSISVAAQTKYQVITLSDDFAQIQDETGYGDWVPVWYLTREAAQTEEITPIEVKATEDMQAR